MDNHATRTHAKVHAWQAKRLRNHVHCTSTSESWMNLMERWNDLISRWAIKHGSFPKSHRPVKTINEFTEHYTESAKPVAWVATAESIVAKLDSLATRMCGTSD